jgi:hypothetical protein
LLCQKCLNENTILKEGKQVIVDNVMLHVSVSVLSVLYVSSVTLCVGKNGKSAYIRGCEEKLRNKGNCIVIKGEWGHRHPNKKYITTVTGKVKLKICPQNWLYWEGFRSFFALNCVCYTCEKVYQTI